jgi:hypothetical protein
MRQSNLTQASSDGAIGGQYGIGRCFFEILDDLPNANDMWPS